MPASEPGRSGPTPSDPELGASASTTLRATSATLRAERARLVDDVATRGTVFGAALADAIDAACRTSAVRIALPGSWAVVALGSYARRELCPGSDLDVLLLHDGRGDAAAVATAAEGLWYPLWDSGFVTGHGVRTAREALALADADLDALTALLDLRPVAGSADLVGALGARARRLATKRRARVVRGLADAAELRRVRPGPIAEMLEPNLKEGAGGLRDLHALSWAGATLGHPAPGLEALVAGGYLDPSDLVVLGSAAAHLLDVRVALHRTTAGSSDALTLQEQDAVAVLLGDGDADILVRRLARRGSGRDVDRG